MAIGASVGCSAGEQPPETTTTTAQAFTVSGDTVTGSLERDVSFNVEADFDCQKDKFYLTWTGTWLLRDVKAALRLQNNRKGTKTTESQEVIASLAVEPETAITVARKGAIIGNDNAGIGNPYVMVMPQKNGHNLLSEPLNLGRCNGKGKFAKRFDFTALAKLLMRVRPDPVDNNACYKDPANIYIDGTLETVLGEIHAKVWFQKNPVQRTYAEQTELDFTLTVETPRKLEFAKSPKEYGAGGNPLVAVCVNTKYNDCDDKQDPWLILGRCNKL
jgi:hypothetical protein